MISQIHITNEFTEQAMNDIQTWAEANLIDDEPAGNILFSTTFDGSVNISDATGGQEILGTDSGGTVFPTDMPGNGKTVADGAGYANWFNYVMDWDCPGGDSPDNCDPTTDYVETRIDTIPASPSGATTALYMKYIKNDTSYVSDTRNQYILRALTTGDVYEKFDHMYMKQRMKITFTGAGSNTWCLPFEWKQDSDNYGRFGIYIYGIGSTPYWRVQSQELNDGSPGTIYWDAENHVEDVPLDEWFDVEIFWIGSPNDADGKVQMAVNGTLIFNETGRTKGKGNDREFYWMPWKIYGKPGDIMVTDVIFAKEPISGSILPGSDV